MISITVSTSEKFWIKEYYLPRQKRILQLLFRLVEIITEIRKDYFLKNNLVLASEN